MKKLHLYIAIFICVGSLLLSCQNNEEDQFNVNEIIRMESIDALNLSNGQKVEVALALVERYNIDNSIKIKKIDPYSEAYNHLDAFRKLTLSSYVQLKTNKVIEEINLNEKYDKRYQNARTNSEAAQIAEEFNQEVDSIMAEIEKEAKIW